MTDPINGELRLGVDLGGSKIEAVALEECGTVRWRERVITPRGDYDATVDAVGGLVDRAERELGRRGRVGVGAPGSISPATGLHRNANSTCLNGRPLHADLERRLARRIRLSNDANCFALSEATLGAARGARVVFGVILGTGVGGGVVVDGRVLDGHNGIAGEWGHNPMPGTDRAERDARRCYCGQRGCREMFLAGPALEAEYRARCGEERSLAAIAERAPSGGDAAAATVIAGLVEGLARSLAEVVNLLDPDCIVLGGGVSNVPALPREVSARLAGLVFADVCTTPVVPAALGDASGVFGAAML
jgi:predicted NBD/HSP70 family sugar kinase